MKKWEPIWCALTVELVVILLVIVAVNNNHSTGTLHENPVTDESQTRETQVEADGETSTSSDNLDDYLEIDPNNIYNLLIETSYNQGIRKFKFVSGNYKLSYDTVNLLMNDCEIIGDGTIEITDFYKWNNSKYSGNGVINVSDLQNQYIASLNLPHEGKPINEHTHQNKNGWITNYDIDSYEGFYKIVPWFQVYAEESNANFTEDDGNITICIAKAKFRYYDQDSNQWVVKQYGALPCLYGFYGIHYEGGTIFKGIMSGNKDASTIYTDCGDYWEVNFPATYFNSYVLHFGYEILDIPTDKSVFFISETNVWVKEACYANRLVSNAGADLMYRGADGSKIRKEYVGGRYRLVTNSPKEICVAYVESHSEWLRDVLNYAEIIQPSGMNVIYVNDQSTNTKYGVTYYISNGDIFLNGTATADFDIPLSGNVLSSGVEYTIGYRIKTGEISDDYIYYGYNSQECIKISQYYFQKNVILDDVTRNKLRIRKGQVYDNVILNIWAWKGKNIGVFEVCK